MPVRRLLRALASLLATVALASAAARPVMACEMGMPVVPAADVAHDAAAGPHAHHVMPAAAGPGAAPSEAVPAGAPAPAMPACDHLVGCAVMVVASAPMVETVPVVVPEAAPRWTASQPDAPVRALEPPPPRA